MELALDGGGMSDFFSLCLAIFLLCEKKFQEFSIRNKYWNSISLVNVLLCCKHEGKKGSNKNNGCELGKTLWEDKEKWVRKKDL